MHLPRSCIDPGALRIASRLRDAGYEAFVVGGAVRDLVMEKTPKDWDIVTNAPVERIETLFPRTVPVGASFGVVLVIPDGRSYEVARYRTEGPYDDGRRPSHVMPATAEEDVLRRDFTINALLYDPVSETVIDHIGGIADIRTGVIRTIGDPDARFGEDRLRMLRAVRFAARLGFAVDPAAMNAIRRSAAALRMVSPERIGQELSSMISGEHPDVALALLDSSGLLAVALPEIAALKGVAQPPEYHPEGDVFEHTKEMLRLFGGGSMTLGFGILFHDVGKPATRTVEDRIRFSRHDQTGAELAAQAMRRLRFPRETIDRVAALVRDHMRFAEVPRMRKATLRRFMSQDNFDELLELHRLDCLASSGNLAAYNFIRNALSAEAAETERNTHLPEPFLSGRDLIDLGRTPGPSFKIILDRVYDEQLEGRVRNREEAIAFLLSEFPAENR